MTNVCAGPDSDRFAMSMCLARPHTAGRPSRIRQGSSATRSPACSNTRTPRDTLPRRRAMRAVRFSLLGRVEVRRPDGSVLHLPSRKALALLTYLVIQPGEFQPRDKLAALLWGDTPNERARHSLRQALATVRGALDS